MGTRRADHATPLYPQKLALTSPTGGGRSVGIVRSRTKATELIIRYQTVGIQQDNLERKDLHAISGLRRGARSLCSSVLQSVDL